MTGTANMCVFSVAVTTCFNSCLFAFCFSMMCACECHKFTNYAILMNSYDLPRKVSGTRWPGYKIYIQNINFLSFEKYCDIENVFYCILRWKK